MARVIVVCSGKGGVGKTTFTASVGIELAEQGNKVLLIDGDVGLNNLDLLLGLENKVNYDMLDVLDGKCRIKQALISDENIPNLHVLPSSHAVSSDDIGAKNFRTLINRLAEGFDFIFIDCPAGIEKGFHRAVSGANEAIVVTTPHISAIRDADKVVSLLSSYELNSVNLIINRARGDLIVKGEMMDTRDIARLLKLPILGVVPEDDNISIFSGFGRLADNCSKARESYAVIADNILTGRRRVLDPTRQYRGVMGKIKLLMKSQA